MPPPPVVTHAQSMKQLQSYNSNNTYKKVEFFSPVPNKYNVNDVKCPEEKPKFEFQPKGDSSPASNNSPGFEFKKKKATLEPPS